MSETKSENNKGKTKNLFAELDKICAGLYYISETDAPLTPFTEKRKKAGAEKITAAEVLELAKRKPDEAVKTQSVADFLKNSVTEQDWHSDEDKQQVQGFRQLQETLEKNLRDVCVYRIGKIELDVYAVGLDAAGNLTGVKTRAVET